MALSESTKHLIRNAARDIAVGGRDARKQYRQQYKRLQQGDDGESAVGYGAEILDKKATVWSVWEFIAETAKISFFWIVFSTLLAANAVSSNIFWPMIEPFIWILMNAPRLADCIPGVDVPNVSCGGSSSASSFKFDGNIIADLGNAISDQESGHSYNALNPHSGAMGRWQFMPGTARAYVSFGSTQEFLNSRELQHQAFEGYINDGLAEVPYLEGCELARAIASYWYSGDPNLRNNTRPQYYNGGSYPSIKDYSDSVASKTSCERW
ncbi:MAG: hypothetical protein AAFR31_21490 [Cyanobacteria bacterium J06627_8]